MVTAELVKPGVTTVYANWGRWMAMCSWRDRCDAAMQLPHFTDGFICTECGQATAVIWPSAEMVAGIERLLLMRPHVKNQNWQPGEDLHDLLEENLQHGIITQHAAGIEQGGIFSIQGDHVSVDALPRLNPRRELVR